MDFIPAHDRGTDNFGADGLTLSRGSQQLFRHLSFKLNRGEALILRGANGSGKTSLLRVLAGLTTVDSGHTFWNGRVIKPLDATSRRLMFYVAHANAIKDDLSAFENLRAALQLDGLSRAGGNPEAIQKALDEVGLPDRRDLPAKKLSQGQKRRIGLARLALIDKPIWLLDEPTNALDTDGVNLFTSIVNRHLARGGMACIASHLPMQLMQTSTQKSTEINLQVMP